MAATGRLDLAVFDGDDYAVELQFVDTEGDPFDLTGHTLTAPIRKSVWDDTPPFEFAVDDTNKATGLLVLSLADEADPDDPTVGSTAAAPYLGSWSLVSTVGDTVHTLLAGILRKTREAPQSLATITVEIGADSVTVVATEVIGAAQLADVRATIAPAARTDEWLKLYGAEPDALVVGVITRDGDGAALAAGIEWPDGTAGTYTADAVSSSFPGAVDAYHLTYSTQVVTQPAVTRDPATGAITDRPALEVT